MKNVADKFVEKIKTHILRQKPFFLKKKITLFMR